MSLEVKKHRDNYEVNIFNKYRRKNKAVYHNIIDRDPKRIALILHDLEIEGFPIAKAITLFKSIKSEVDWLGI